MGGSESWSTSTLPDPLWLHVFGQLGRADLGRCAQVNAHWYRVANDVSLWRRLFRRDFHLSDKHPLDGLWGGRFMPDDFQLHNEPTGWRDEYRRLRWTAPTVPLRVLHGHADEVWRTDDVCPVRERSSVESDPLKGTNVNDSHKIEPAFGADMARRLHWKYTQFAQFNCARRGENGNDDPLLLLVSGVKAEDNRSGYADGEIVVFELNEESGTVLFRCRAHNRPYDVFGCWFDANHFLCGDHTFVQVDFDRGMSVSQLWLCKASQELQSERTAVLAPMYKFLNRNMANMRMVCCSGWVSNGVREAVLMHKLANGAGPAANDNDEFQLSPGEEGAKTTIDKSLWRPILFGDNCKSADGDWPFQDCCMNCKDAKRRDQTDGPAPCTCLCHKSPTDRMLVYTTGTKCYVPHQVAFKLVSGEETLSLLRGDVMSPDRRERIMERIREEAAAERERAAAAGEAAAAGDDAVDNDMDVDAEAAGAAEADIEPRFAQDGQGGVNDAALEEFMRMFDMADHTIDMDGHIVGLTLSRDGRYVVVNVRQFISEVDVTQPLNPPNIDEQINVRLIDLETLSLVRPSPSYVGSWAFTTNDGVFFIFVDALGDWLASGSECGNAPVWSRRHGALLAQGYLHGLGLPPAAP